MDNSYDTKHLKVLDGIRALAIIIIVWFHFWQQNWLMPVIGHISLDFIPRYGFLFVDADGYCPGHLLDFSVDVVEGKVLVGEDESARFGVALVELGTEIA